MNEDTQRLAMYFLGGIIVFLPIVLMGEIDSLDLSVLSDTFLRLDGNNSNASFGLTDNSSYWLCTSADCSSSCQVRIIGGFITNC